MKKLAELASEDGGEEKKVEGEKVEKVERVEKVEAR